MIKVIELVLSPRIVSFILGGGTEFVPFLSVALPTTSRVHLNRFKIFSQVHISLHEHIFINIFRGSFSLSFFSSFLGFLDPTLSYFSYILSPFLSLFVLFQSPPFPGNSFDN